MVDELSKEHLVIPINLRPEKEKGESTWTSVLEPIITTRFAGFPAADHIVREFFNKGSSHQEVYTRYAAFFTVLFQQLLTHFQSIDTDLAKQNVKPNTEGLPAAKFRSLMTRDQAYDAPNDYREMFYQQVCQKAVHVSNRIYTVIQCSYCTPPQLFKLELSRLNQQKDEPMTGVESTGDLDLWEMADLELQKKK